MPPSTFGLQSLSQEIQRIFLSLFFCPHQNLLTMDPRYLHSDSGNLKQLIVYVGVAWVTALMSVSLLAF